MFEHHYGLRENPFLAGHQPRFVYPSPEHQEALAHLRYGIENREPFVLITGEVGTGKTTALYDALSEWQAHVVVALITNSALTRNELLEEIALRFGVSVPPGASKPQTLVLLERFLLGVQERGDRAILLLDEAQNLDRELLEEIRLLSNLEWAGRKLMQVFLVGQHELEAKLASSELRQLRQRITVHYRLNPLGPEDTERYIHHRITVAGGHGLTIFPSDACREVHGITHGIPREINTVCAQALLNAFVEESPAVHPRHVMAAAQETEFQSVLGGVASSPLSPAPTAEPTPVRSSPAPPPPASAPSSPLPPTAAPPPAAPISSTPPSSALPPRAPQVGAPISRAPKPPAAAPVTPAQEPAAAAPVARAPEPTVPAPPPAPAFVEPITPAATSAATPQPQPAPAAEPPLAIPVIESWITSRPQPPERGDDRPPLPSHAASGAAEPPGIVLSGAGQVVVRTSPTSATTEPSPLAASAIPESVAAPSPARSGSAGPARRSLAEEQRSAALPPRLRDKLEAGRPADEKRNGGAPRWLVVVGFIAVVAASAVVLVRLGTWAGARMHSAVIVKPTPAPTEPAPLTGDSTRSAAPEGQTPTAGNPPAAGATASNPPAAGTTAGGAPAPHAANVVEPGPTASAPTAIKPVTTGPQAATTGKPEPASPTAATPAKPADGTQAAAAPKRSYAIAVGTYLNEERANAERTKLGASTRLAVRVLTATDGGISVYRVVMGSYDSRGAAERAASDLIDRGLVDEARVIPLARATSTRR